MSEQRMPKQGEVWTLKRSTGEAVIRGVDGERVFFWYPDCDNVQEGGIQIFIREFTPPKPKPREIWVNCYDGGDVFAYDTREKALDSRALPSGCRTIRFIEAEEQPLSDEGVK